MASSVAKYIPPSHLPSQQMEVLRRFRRIDDLHVDAVSVDPVVLAVGQLQEPLESARAVLRTGAVVAVRQEHRQAAAQHPLSLAARHVRVDDDLRAVEEVAELGLPDGQRVRRR